MGTRTRVFTPPAYDRVRANTPQKINDRIDRKALGNIRYYARRPKHLISAAIEELDREWDIDQFMQTTTAAITLGSTLLALVGSKRWLVVPAVVTGFLMNHAIRGWCPQLPLFRRLNIRTRSEIDAEKYALKALRGDFDVMCTPKGRTELAQQLIDVAMSA